MKENSKTVVFGTNVLEYRELSELAAFLPVLLNLNSQSDGENKFQAL